MLNSWMLMLNKFMRVKNICKVGKECSLAGCSVSAGCTMIL